jgi:hypothetical protein
MLARLGGLFSTLVLFPISCQRSTFSLSSSGGGLPGRLATLTESRRPFYFVRCFCPPGYQDSPAKTKSYVSESWGLTEC